jgi:hypothetical protein
MSHFRLTEKLFYYLNYFLRHIESMSEGFIGVSIQKTKYVGDETLMRDQGFCGKHAPVVCCLERLKVSIGWN